MEWTEQHDICLCKEVRVIEPYMYKKGSIERGKGWSKIADNLNSCTEIKFKVNQRSVRERFSLLQTRFKQKEKQEIAASGINPPEQSELDILLEDIVGKEQEAGENMPSSERKKAAEDKCKAEEMRKKALEKMGETKKRNNATNNEEGEVFVSESKRKRRSGSETIEYLKEKNESEKKLKEAEIELKKKESEQQLKRAEAQEKQMSDMMKMQQSLLQQQQQQNQVMMTMMQAFMNKFNQ